MTNIRILLHFLNWLIYSRIYIIKDWSGQGPSEDFISFNGNMLDSIEVVHLNGPSNTLSLVQYTVLKQSTSWSCSSGSSCSGSSC